MAKRIYRYPAVLLVLFLFVSISRFEFVKKTVGNMSIAADSTEMPAVVNYKLLEKQNVETCEAIVNLFRSSEDFNRLATMEGDLILKRDQEDAAKLQVGIDYAKDKGILDQNFVPEPYVNIDALGKSSEYVSDTIIEYMAAWIQENQVEAKEADTTSNDDLGHVIVITGLSGTGKGTVVALLSEKLSKTQQVESWSNGNIFRSLTLLAVIWCEQQLPNGTFDAQKALTKENLESFMTMLSFGKFNGKFDTRIQGLGLDLLVSEVQNTILKQPKISKTIPTVAEVTQGQVILFATSAIQIMREGGTTVVLEGREQTVNYVRTPLRFSLTFSDETIIGKRRAAQRLMAAAWNSLQVGASDEDLKKILDLELAKLLHEIET